MNMLWRRIAVAEMLREVRMVWCLDVARRSVTEWSGQY
jgi:hypothetical protein